MNIKYLKQKIALGTVQLGLKYGINNQSGKPDEVEAHRILDKAASEEISLLDSAEAYGNSLNVIGAYLKRNQDSPFRIISKFIGDSEPLKDKVNRTLSHTGQDSLYAFLFHRFSDYQSGEYLGQLLDLKKEGKIKRIGVSLYNEMELEASLRDPDISVIQIPFNPFDASEQKKKLLVEARSYGKEIHVRSIFLQGLFFKETNDLTGNLKGFIESLQTFHSLLKDYGIRAREACLNYVLHQPFIDYIIIGVETRNQLEENLQSILTQCPAELFDQLEAIRFQDKFLLNPANWKP